MYPGTKLGFKEILSIVTIMVVIIISNSALSEEGRYRYMNLTLEYMNGSINVLNQSISYFDKPVKQVLGSNILYLLAEDRNTVLYKQYFLIMPFGIFAGIDPITKQKYEEFEYPKKVITNIYVPYMQEAKYMLFTDIGGGNETVLLLAPIEEELLKGQPIAIEKPRKVSYWLLLAIVLVLLGFIWLFIALHII